MSSFRDIPDSELAVGQGVSQTLMQSLKDNTDAVFRGGDLALQIKPAALERATGSGGSSATTKILELSDVFTNDDSTHMGFKVRTAGTYRVHLEIRLADSPDQSGDGDLIPNTVVATIQKNGVNQHQLTHVLDHQNSTSNNHAETTHDLSSLSVGDHINIVIDVDGITTTSSDGGNITMSVMVDDVDAMWGVNVYGVL